MHQSTKKWVSVEEVDKILDVLLLAKGKSDLDSRMRRSIGLAVNALTKAKQRSRGERVSLEISEMLRILRCLAELSDLFSEYWARYFV